jgi:uncharacterized protein YdbL (DUF1318 family)
MKTFKNLIAEVAQPKAGDEKAFKDKHIVTMVGHPVALDHQFTGEIPGTAKVKRRADLAPGEDAAVYEALDKVNPKAVKKKFDDRKDKDIDNDGDIDSSDEYLHKRRQAISKNMKEADLDEAPRRKGAPKMSGDFIKIQRAKDAAHNAAMGRTKTGRKKPVRTMTSTQKSLASMREELDENAWEEIPMMMNSLRSMSHNISGISRYLQSTQDPEEWFQNKLAGVAKEIQTLYSYATAEVMAMGEEAELEEARQLKNPKTEVMVVDNAGKTIVIDKTKQKEYLAKGWMLAESVNEITTPMRNRFGPAVDSKKFDAYKKHMKTHKLDEPTVRMIHQNPDDAESKRMIKNPKYKEAIKLYKASIRESNLDEATMSRVAKELEDYARKYGGIDKMDFIKAAMMMKKGQTAQLKKFVDDLDTEPREKILSLMDKDSDRRKEYKAVQKKMREEVELDEAKKTISQKTITRALQGMKVKPKGEVSLKKAPWDKKEETEIDEELNEKFKTGMVKLKDGSSVILKKQDTDLLNQMFKNLSSANRKKMQNTAMADKVGFEEILGFAREAM